MRLELEEHSFTIEYVKGKSNVFERTWNHHKGPKGLQAVLGPK